MVFKTLPGQKTHIEEKHCEIFYKCSVCPVAFKTKEGCGVHLLNKHGVSETPPQWVNNPWPAFSKVVHLLLQFIWRFFFCLSFSSRLIFKCSCETVFKKKQLLLEHFHQNANKRVTSVFKCPECNSVFPQKHLLMQHFKVRLGWIDTYVLFISWDESILFVYWKISGKLSVLLAIQFAQLSESLSVRPIWQTTCSTDPSSLRLILG